MSVPNQTPYIIYTANGLTTVFPFEFYIINAGDIQVSLNGDVITTGYSVSGVGNVGGGDVTFLTPPANGTVVMLERVVPTYRLTDYQDNGDLLADTVNKDFDRLWMAIQRSFTYLGLALRRPLFGGPYNAEGFRIANLGDPEGPQDAATKNYVDNVSLVKALRVPENYVAPLPPVGQRANKLLAFNASGQPITVLPQSGSASDVLIELAKPTGAGLVGYKDTTVADQLSQHTAKTIINVSAFGNTGTEQNGSDEAWNNAFAYALSIAPKWKNNYPGPQEWYDFSGIEFVADGNVYPKTSVGLRCTYGGTINLTIVAPDDHTGEYLIDMSVDRGVTPNRAPLYTRFMGAVHCRYKCSGMNLGGSASTTTEHMRVDQFLVYGIDTDGSDTQTSGGHTIGIGTIVEQRSWSSGGDADFPVVVTTGTGIYIRSHDNRLVGATVSYCKIRCVRIKGQSNRLVAGTHLYSGGKQALLHEATSGNTLIDACWLDSSRLQLDGGYITITNNLIYLTQGTDSETGIVTGGSASNILIKNNSFLGYVGGTPVYFGKGVFGDKTVVCYGNRYLPGMNNTDVITTLVPSLGGESTAGTVTLDPSTGFTVTYDGVYVNFTATIRWSSFTGGTGAIGIYGLPFVADRISVMSLQQFTNNTNFASATAIKHTSGTSIRLVKPNGSNVLANDSGVDSGYLVINGKYRPA